MTVKFITPGHPLWRRATAHIRSVYAARYAASVTDFAPELAVATDATGAVICAAGIRSAAEGLFSQVYLDVPMHEALAARSGQKVAASDLIEVVTMACTRPAAALPLLDAIADEGRNRGMSWGIFTGTRPLWTMLMRAGLPVVRLAPARRERLKTAGAWGRYYETDPWVCAVQEPAGQHLRFDPRRALTGTRPALSMGAVA